jgi:hypothetical protein
MVYDFSLPADPASSSRSPSLAVRLTALMLPGLSGVFAYFGLWDVVALQGGVAERGDQRRSTFFVGLRPPSAPVFVTDWALVLFMLAGCYGLRARCASAGGNAASAARGRWWSACVARTDQSAMFRGSPHPYRSVGFIDDP